MASIDEFRSILAKWDKVIVVCELLVPCLHAHYACACVGLQDSEGGHVEGVYHPVPRNDRA